MMNNKSRIGIGALMLSAAALVGIGVSEGYTEGAVIPTKGDVPTIGFGATEGVKMGDKTNPVKALQRLMVDVNKYEGAVKQCVKVPLSQAEYDLYVDLAYNIGTSGFCGSTIVKRLNQQNYAGACEAILMWKNAAGYDCSTMVNGKPNTRCYGLWERRKATYNDCMAAQ
jgi:lysozyme